MADRTPGSPLVVAARDLAPGTVLASGDLKPVTMPGGLMPAGSFAAPADVLGRTLSVALAAGTPITAVALSSEALVDHGAAEVLVPVRVHDADVASLLHVGDRLTIVASSPDGLAETVAEHVRVAQLPRSASGGPLSGGGTSGALIVVAAGRDVASRVAATSDQWLGVIIE